MAGLLGDGWDDPQSAAMMALAGGMVRGDFGGALMGANQAYSDHRANATKTQLARMEIEQRRMALEDLKRKQADDEAARSVLREAYAQRGLPQSPSGPAGGPPGDGMMPGAAPGGATGGAMPGFGSPSRVAGAVPPKVDLFQQYTAIGDRMASQGLSGKAQEYYTMAEKYRPKFNTTPQQMVVNGKLTNVLLSEDGTAKTLDGFEVKPDMVEQDLGGKKLWVDKNALIPGQSFAKSMTPGETAGNQLGWANNALTRRGQDLTDGRARETNAAGKVPAGYRMKMDGSMEAIPGGPADIKAGAEGQKKAGDAKDVLGLLDEVDALLPKATGSYAGVGVDAAAGALGMSTGGAKASAQLKALQGALVGKMPKMSGPQSDKDVLLYREMAGQVGDPTIPVAQRQAASAIVRKLNEKYAGMEEGSSVKIAAPFVDAGKEQRYQEWKARQAR